METKKEEQAHKELDKKISNCDCCPIGKFGVYCDDCIKVIVDFANKYGAGVLTRDGYIEELKEEKESFRKLLGSKIHQLALLDEKYQKLKRKIKRRKE